MTANDNTDLFRRMSAIWTGTPQAAPDGRTRLVGRWASHPTTGRAVFGWVQPDTTQAPVSFRPADPE